MFHHRFTKQWQISTVLSILSSGLHPILEGICLGHRPGADSLFYQRNPAGRLITGLLSLAFLLLPADSNFHSISTRLTGWFWVQFAATTLLWPVEFSLPGNPSFHTPPQSLALPAGVLINIWMIASPWVSSICQAEPVCYSLNLKCPLNAHVL